VTKSRKGQEMVIRKRILVNDEVSLTTGSVNQANELNGKCNKRKKKQTRSRGF
jgi:hypothetical protein